MAYAIRYGLVLFLLSLLFTQTSAQPSAEAEIRAAFKQWTDDFNAKRTDEVCDLFARDLQADYRGVPSRGYDRQCQILHESLSDPERRYFYALAIREILVFGDIAVARITWTLTIRRTDGQESKVIEPGLDVFRREADGKWRIIRYLAYDDEVSGVR
jgi:steroid delta-isomerase